jgi:O-antigen/teichoic acid export membrane protein
VSSQAAVLDPAGAPRAARRQTFAGAWLLSAAMVVSGALTYAFHVLAARSLGAEAYGQVAVLWGAMFIAVVVLFRPLEQTTSRALAHRLARGQDTRTVLRSAVVMGVLTMIVLCAAFAAGWHALTNRLFLGHDAMTAFLLAGIAFYGLAYFTRGLLGGAGWFDGIGIALIGDAVARLLVAAPLVLVASRNIAAAACMLAAFGGVVVPLYLGRRRLTPLLEAREGPPFHFRTAVGFAGPASLMAAADQLLVNGAPLLVMLDGKPNASATAGVVFAATMLVRVPVYVFQGVATSILPNLTRLHADGDGTAFRRAVVRTSLLLLGTSAVVVVLAAAAGPGTMRLLFGGDFVTGRIDLALLGAGVGCYLAASTLSQALLALARGWRAAGCWTTAALFFVGLYVALPGSELRRISAAFLCGIAACMVMLAVALARALRER